MTGDLRVKQQEKKQILYKYEMKLTRGCCPLCAVGCDQPDQKKNLQSHELSELTCGCCQ